MLFCNINFTHINVTFHTEICCSSSYGNTVLTCTCFSNNLLFTHIFCKQTFAHTMVKLMCACMVKIFSFKINLAITKNFGKSFAMVNRSRSALKFLSYSAKFVNKLCRMADCLVSVISFFKSLLKFRCDVRTAVFTEVSVF